MEFKSLEEAESFLNKQTNQIFIGEKGLERAKNLLELLGNPQNNLKVIHIAGTSGKGSTAYLTAKLLESQGFKVGLYLSPHLLTIRERLQINGQLISEEKFVQDLNEIMPAIEKCTVAPSYFDILTALAFYVFDKKQVDYAVMETGIGGLLDATNTVGREDKLAIITKIGLDHVQVLGNTLEKIATQKAGIIPENGIVISIDQDPNAMKVIEETAQKKRTKLYKLDKIAFSNIRISEQRTSFDFSFEDLELKNIELGLIGDYQAENCSLALAALELLSKRDSFSINLENLRNVLQKAQFEGRFTKIELNGKTIIMDGAHNAQKMSGFISNLKSIYPNQKFTFLVAFKEEKEFKEMIKLIIPVAEKIVISQFAERKDFPIHSVNSDEIANVLKDENFSNYSIFNEVDKAIDVVLEKTEKYLIVTGSFYFLGDVLGILVDRR